MDRIVEIPARYLINGSVLHNPVRQLATPVQSELFTLVSIRVGRRDVLALERADNSRIVLVERRNQIPDGTTHAIVVRNLEGIRTGIDSFVSGEWCLPECVSNVGTSGFRESQLICERVTASWVDRFRIIEEIRRDNTVTREGLRPPQVGALYAMLAHWKVTDEPATVVLPTGTGKTETMIALMCAVQAPRVLVIVPTNNLREQLGNKFMALGLLRRWGILAPDAEYPVICLLQHKPRSINEANEIFLRCNVIVTTMNIAGSCVPEVQQRISELVTHVFIDEAHHVRAKTWMGFREVVKTKPIVQFTATPFRNDGKHIDGKSVFNYPLRKAQKEGYFQTIRFITIDELDPADADSAIALKAIDQVRQDLAAGHQHLVMARCEGISRAQRIHALYTQLAPDLNPAIIHNDMSKVDANAALEAIRIGTSKIVVCVDMLGEGFDLPELKIAALHDAHKSLAITLQFTGRFTRPRIDLGAATVIANIADPQMADNLRSLYAEDADWNLLLRTLSEGANNRHTARSDFLDGFQNAPTTVALQNIFPKMSAVVYRTRCHNWEPHAAVDAVLGGPVIDVHAGPTVNHQQRLILFVTRELDPVPWGDIRDVHNTVWNLYLIHWDKTSGLLYINSSNNATLHEELAEAVCGTDVELIRGENVFRALHNVKRLVLNNLGLSDLINHHLRHSQHMGLDISEALPEALRLNKRKTNLFGRGFENGTEVSVGCSLKGRVWSMTVAEDLASWVKWCHGIGAKLADNTISTRDVFSHVVLPQSLNGRPNQIPILIEWPETFLGIQEDRINVLIDGESAWFYDAELEITAHTDTGPILFRVHVKDRSAEYELVIDGNGTRCRRAGVAAANVRIGKRERPLEEWFGDDPPIIRFASGAYLEGTDFYQVPVEGSRVPFTPERIEVWDWTGVDVRVESQTQAKLLNSVQRHVINKLLSVGSPPDIVFDDDARGEAADVICVSLRNDRIQIELYHCKYILRESGIAGVDDLYTVCGQAQRSARWRGAVSKLLRHMRLREHSRKKRALADQRAHVSRFERGDEALLKSILSKAEVLPADVRVLIVQPGLSVSNVEERHLDLLATTELYLSQTAAFPFQAIGRA